MQNKANLLDAQINVSSVLTKDYENDNAFRPHENKANQTQFQTQPLSAPKNTLRDCYSRTMVYNYVSCCRLVGA